MDIKEEGKKYADKLVEESGRPILKRDIAKAFEDGYNKALEVLEENRLKACDDLSPEASDREMNFVTDFIQKNHRTPTFSDCIEKTREDLWQSFRRNCLDLFYTKLPNGEVVPRFDDEAIKYIYKQVMEGK